MNEIKGIARVKFLPGKVEEWKRLTAQVLGPGAPKSWTPGRASNYLIRRLQHLDVIPGDPLGIPVLAMAGREVRSNNEACRPG